jgi:hypothetical protein
MSNPALSSELTRLNCEVKDGKFVVMCSALEKIAEGYAAFSKAKGIRVWQYYRVPAGGMAHSFVGIKCKAYPDGFLFNFCPCCGTNISAPFTADETEVPHV